MTEKMIRNIGERMRVEAVLGEKDAQTRAVLDALAESEQRFRSFMENTPAVAFMKDSSGRYVYANERWKKLFARPEGFEGLNDYDLFDSQVAEELSRRDQEVLRSGQVWEGQEDVPIPGEGVRHWLVYKFPFTNAAGEKFLGGAAFDITERIEAEQEVLRLNAELEERVKKRTAQLEAVNRELEAFTYSVSHDLRAPLRGMSGFARVLEEDYGPQLDDDARRYLSIIQSNAAQMGQLIDDLLNLSRLGRQPLKRSMVSLEELARDTFHRVSADERSRTIEFTVDPLPSCRVDANLMLQVLVNLFSNAIKFTQHRSPAKIHMGCRKQDGETVFFIRDNGAGFDMRYANKLFGVFQRLHSNDEFEGTGVGLAIVKRIIDRHGGRVWAEGAPDVGATFYFSLGGESCNAG